MSFLRLDDLKSKKYKDPFDAFQGNDLYREVFNRLKSFPIIVGDEEPEGVVPADTGALFLLTGQSEGKAFLKVTGNRTTTGWYSVQTAFDSTFTERIFTGTNIGLGTTPDVSYVDVSVTNASLTFDVKVPGIYKIEFTFSHFLQLLDINNGTLDVLFRLTDGNFNTNGVDSGFAVNGNAIIDPFIKRPISMRAYFKYSTLGQKTIRLQKRNITAASVSGNLILVAPLSGETRALHMSAYRISA